MRSYTVQKITGAPNWDAIAVMPMDNYLWEKPVDVTAQTQICWDDTALYIRQVAMEANIRAEQEGPLALPWKDSCLELFIRPTEYMRYFNFEMNPKCALCLGYGPNGPEFTRLIIRNVDELFAPKARLIDGGWELTYRIPFAFVRRFFPEFEAAEGLVMHANAYKCGDDTARPHYLSWNYIDLEKPDFHCPEYFGELILGGE